MKKDKYRHLKDKANEFLANKRNANNVVDIIAVFEGEDEGGVSAAMRALHRIFSSIIAEKAMFFDTVPTEDQDLKDLDADGKFRVWLRELYADFRRRLLELLAHPNSNIQELSLCTLMKLLESESKTPLKKISNKHITFPTLLFQQIVQSLSHTEVPLDDLITRFQEYMDYDDVRYYAMKNILSSLKEKKEQDADLTVYLGNVYHLLTNLSMPGKTADEELKKIMSRKPESGGTIKMTSLKEQRKMFTQVWITYLSMKLPTSLYKKVLLVLADKVMPYMSNPLLLADFLTNSYNIGGAVSLLALNGLFVLVNAFNLDYPDFYKKLYALFQPGVFHVKYKARFFFLADLFLTSTHLPGYLVAAFTKRLSRLSLTAPPAGISLLLPFIHNLINRHPNCKILIHNPDGLTDLESDPYLVGETDPAKCKALESSLWEIKTLQSHYHHSIVTEAKKINRPLNKAEIDISEILELDTDQLFEKEIKKKQKTMPVTFEVATSLFGNKEDQFSDLWVLA